jgi:class 3 adenylate cyclase
MERRTQTGYLVLADISGFTSFVAQTEIEHAEKAISILLEAVIERLDDMLTIVKLEGDAVFAYVPDEKMPDCAAMLGLVDETYRIFRNASTALNEQANCPCRACRAIPMLDLKFMIHHGEYIVQQFAGIRDLLGNDVTLLHRLAKNRVTETTGWNGYMLITGHCIDRMQADKKPFLQQAETYEHLGEVSTYIMNMHDRYKD